jgi:acetyl esterase/lipase
MNPRHGKNGHSYYWLVSLAMLVLTTVANAQPTAGVTPPPNTTVIEDITFATVDGHELMLDLYLPAGVDTPPLLVWVHGGAWRAGSRKGVNAIDVTRAGFAIASVSYRLSTIAAFPAQVYDIKGAIRYLRAHSADYGYDATKIGIMGSSAGAHLAALVAVTNGSKEHEGTVGGNRDTSSDVQALVSYFGASNLLSILDQSTPFGLGVRVPALELLFGGPIEEKQDLARLASPVFYVDAGDPPMFLLHGDQDPQMPINQTHELHGAAKAQGLDAHFEVVHGAGHGGESFFDAERTHHVTEFLSRYLVE